MKKCPYCAEEIQDEAIKCRYCGSLLAPEPSAGVPGATIPPFAGGPSIPGPPPSDAGEALQYTHSGTRYLLGYGTDFFGIWDRQGPTAPVSRFPRNDDGWRAAWLAFSAQEPDAVEVGIAGTTTRGPRQAGVAGAPRRAASVNGAWWLLPIFMGWLGGLIAWLVNRDIDPQKARAMLITGIAISAVIVLLAVAAASSVTGG